MRLACRVDGTQRHDDHLWSVPLAARLAVPALHHFERVVVQHLPSLTADYCVSALIVCKAAQAHGTDAERLVAMHQCNSFAMHPTSRIPHVVVLGRDVVNGTYLRGLHEPKPAGKHPQRAVIVTTCRLGRSDLCGVQSLRLLCGSPRTLPRGAPPQPEAVSVRADASAALDTEQVQHAGLGFQAAQWDLKRVAKLSDNQDSRHRGDHRLNVFIVDASWQGNVQRQLSLTQFLLTLATPVRPCFSVRSMLRAVVSATTYVTSNGRFASVQRPKSTRTCMA